MIISDSKNPILTSELNLSWVLGLVFAFIMYGILTVLFPGYYEDQKWPPSCKSCRSVDQEIHGSMNIYDLQNTYTSENTCCIYRNETKKDTLGLGIMITEGRYHIPISLFGITQASPGYSNISYEVIAVDEQNTIIELKGDNDDCICVWPAGRGTNGGDEYLSDIFTRVGTKVRYGGHVFQIRGAGWYRLDGKYWLSWLPFFGSTNPVHSFYR